MARTRRKKAVGVETQTGLIVESAYCRKCRQQLPPKNFLAATDINIDTNGLMSICTPCINDMYENFYQTELSMERTILRLCRILNLVYDESAINALRVHLTTMEANGKKTRAVFGIYKTKLLSVRKGSREAMGGDPEELVFVEPMGRVGGDPLEDADVEMDIQEYWRFFWGDGLTVDDYEYMDLELAQWQATNKCDTHGELSLMKILCYIQNDIRKARLEQSSTAQLEKRLMEAMSKAALTPDKQNAAAAGKSHETYGEWIKDIEEKTPAEWWEDQDLYKDVDDIVEYIKLYIERPMRNFVTGSRDFTVEEIGEISGGTIDIIDEEDDDVDFVDGE